MADYSVVLLEPRYQGNIGSVARVMKNFGFSRLVLVNPPRLGGEARAMAMHARDILEGAEVFDCFREVRDGFDFLVGTSAVAASDKNHLRNPVYPEDLVNSLDIRGEVALVFGREDYGLLNEELRGCDLLITIPASKEYPTMNLASSAAVILYEISRLSMRSDMQSLRKFREAGSVEKRVLLEKFDSLADQVYGIDFERRLVKKTFRQIVGRAFISGRESFNLTGIFRKSADRIRQEGLRKKKRG